MPEAHSAENVYNKLSMDIESTALPSFEDVQSIMQDLSVGGEYLITRPYNDENIIYEPREGLSWPDIVHLDNPIKKQILLYFVENPKTVFVFYNTQKGKSLISSIELNNWAKEPNHKVVGVVIVDNDLTLGEQSRQGFEQNIAAGSKVFMLSSNSSANLETIMMYIDAYAADKRGTYKMPVIVALQNEMQTKKVVSILRSIQERINDTIDPSNLRYSLIIDECDKTYPPIRNRLLPFISDFRALHQIVFVSATEGDLLDDYEECFNSKFYHVDSDSPNYRAMHTADAIIHRVKSTSRKQKPNDYAETILANNADHFMTPMVLPSGEVYYRKVIVNGNTSNRDMVKFAKDRVEEGSYALTFNQSGISVYRPGGEDVKRFRAKGKKFNEVLMWIYVTMNLRDRPIFIIGRRKVDRGLGFHYAPKSVESKEMDMFHTKITIENGHGLIFTDIILGHIENPQSAVQKAGRLAGIIAQCPQYPGTIDFWTDDQTACTVINHNRMVDEANRLSGVYSALQATTRAMENITREVPKKQTMYEVSDNSFESLGAANDWYIENCSYMIKFKHRDGTETLKKYGKSEYGLYKKSDQDVLVECSELEATHIKYRGDARELQSEEYTRNCGDLGQGVKSSARIMPVRGENGSIRYIVIYKAKPK